MLLSISGSVSRFVASASIVVVSACGGAPPSAPEVPGDDHDHEHHHQAAGHGEHGHDGHHGEHEHGTGEHGGGRGHGLEDGPLKDFHEVIAPVWHAEPGKVRVEAACANAPKLKERAAALGTPPAAAQKDEAGWKTDGAALVSSIDALTTACAAAGRPDVESALSKVHDGFHRLMERAK